ncbi:ParA family protein [Lactiplantibacillus plantarum]|uniref:ParA family protein n=1 Tax=Lactiplantibacillus plantarum TaxID=1590 RepID=UPI001BA7630F|nr:ParA family protein [Lactiplantibacillus plantarum]MBS0936366.1 ParA family protein [Lactiplantibacillus plantarum]MBS0943795.1 ParA family protein [Lactiplantibacillus plantarum]
MKIITFTAIKGGVGKTTLTLNYGDWLAKHGKKVLLIDLDHQCNLTTVFEKTRRDNTIAEAFKEDDAQKVKIDNVGLNLDLIAGFIDLDIVGSHLENNSNKEMMLFMWFKDNTELLGLDDYDYILIDTHPDFGTVTKNAIAISNYLLSPITPSEHGYNAKFDLEARLEKFRNSLFDYRTGETYVDAKLYFVGNMIKHNTSMSRNLLKHIEGDETVATIIPERELFNKATAKHTSIFEIANQDKTVLKQNRQFMVQADHLFQELLNKTN